MELPLFLFHFNWNSWIKLSIWKADFFFSGTVFIVIQPCKVQHKMQAMAVKQVMVSEPESRLNLCSECWIFYINNQYLWKQSYLSFLFLLVVPPAKYRLCEIKTYDIIVARFYSFYPCLSITFSFFILNTLKNQSSFHWHGKLTAASRANHQGAILQG